MEAVSLQTRKMDSVGILTFKMSAGVPCREEGVFIRDAAEISKKSWHLTVLSLGGTLTELGKLHTELVLR
jgi:hypothetical protein